MFSFEFSTLEIILFAVIAFAVIVLLALYLPSVARVGRFASRQNRVDTSEETAMPSVSVIVYAHNDAESLTALIPALMSQKYNGQYEVTVVNDGFSKETDDVMSQFEIAFKNLYQTFTPSVTKNLSRKKLSISIGVKAARFDYIVNIMAESAIESDTWLASIARHFNEDGKELVIGYALPHESYVSGKGSRFRAFDTLVDDVEYLSQAIIGNAFRGTAYNIAYSKQIFFEKNGFSDHTNLVNGDDDIFVGKAATRKNTAVEISEPAAVKIMNKYPSDFYSEQKLKYMFTSKYNKSMAHLLTGFYSIMMWVWLIASVGLLAVAVPNLLPLCAVTVMSLALWLPLCFVWKRQSEALLSRKVFLTAPFWLIVRPFNTLKYKLRLRSERETHFTWRIKN